jgi:ubiquinone/menaquinone biosynthesis C-methylase UbiE
MKNVIDNFSKQSNIYRKFRPKYPQDLIEDILKNASHTGICWDCATGNGQVAAELTHYFDKVYASDVSQNQINHAEIKKGIAYSVERAEETSYEDNQFDLITVGQAAHWFDIDAFNREFNRVGKNGCIVAIWGYKLLQVTSEPMINEVISDFHFNKIGPYWSPERNYLEEEYKSFNFDFTEIEDQKNRYMLVNWDLTELEGYINTWSSVQNYKNQFPKKKPVDQLIRKLKPIWVSTEKKEIRFPIFTRFGKVEK